ncbi:MAG: MMPL family transporter, partial [Bacteroidales bacterium]|nr:MMPL family transporter [Bacteroidales bacterium]
FCRLDGDLLLGAMDFALEHFPTLVAPEWYGQIEERLRPEAIGTQMQKNLELLMNDWTGDDTQMVAMDPLALREILLGLVADGSIGGYTMDGGHLFCPDRSVAIAFVTPSFTSTDSGSATRLARLMRREIKAFERENPDVRIFIHGNPLGSVSNAGTIKSDLLFTVGLSLLLILLIMMLSFHKVKYLWQMLLPVLYGTIFALACMYWIKGYMSLMALGLGAIVMGVAISYCLHVLIHFYYVKDAETMLAEESTPVVLGCVTTIGAFMGLLFTESELLRDFGLFSSLALLGNTLFALVFLPHFLDPSQIKFKRTHGFPLVERINSLPWDRSKWILGILGLLAVVGLVFSPRVKFDSDLTNLDYDDALIRESEGLYNRTNADGAAHQYFAAWADNLDDALSYNASLAHAVDGLIEEGVASGYSPFASMLLIPTAEQEARIALWKAFWSPSRVGKLRKDMASAAAACGLDISLFDAFFSILEADYTPGNLATAGIIPPGLLSNFVEHQESGRWMVFTDVSYPAENRLEVWTRLAAEEHSIVLEPFFYCRDMVSIVHDDFSTTLWISSVFVLLVLLLSFRNIWISLIAFFPMFTSWYVMQGYMALFGLEFNLINIVISTFVYGIGVDYSIFVMEGLLKEARTGEKDMLSFHKVAIFYSAMVLAIVTFSLIFARHPAIHSIGIITLIGMASTILLTYSLQPWVFRQLCRIQFLRRSFRIPEQ